MAHGAHVSPVLRVRVDGDQLQGASLVHVALVDLLKLLFEDLGCLALVNIW